MILGLIQEARASGARLKPCCETIGLDLRTVQRWLKRGPDGGEDLRRGPKSEPGNKLTKEERDQVVELATSEDFRDLPPSQIVPRLADMGIYVASESTIYRILKQRSLAKHRGRKRPPKRKRPTQHVATKPNQLWCWDITYLRGPVRGQFFYLYLFLDVWSRKVVGWRVFETQESELAAKMFRELCDEHELDPRGLVLHSDNGAPMKGATMVASLEKLGVLQSFSRPSVSNDNAYAESIFGTVKGRPNYPDKAFPDLDAAQAWVAAFVEWYNDEHRHSGISFVTPSQRHAGLHIELLAHRERVYAKAKAASPERWSRGTRNWKPHDSVWLNQMPAELAGSEASL